MDEKITLEGVTRIGKILGWNMSNQSEQEALGDLVRDTGIHFAQLVERCKRLSEAYPALMENSMFRALFQAAQDGRDNGMELADYIRVATDEQWREPS